MKTIHLQRRGCGQNLNTHGAHNSGLPYFIEIYYHYGLKKYALEICYSCNHELWGVKNGQRAYIDCKLDSIDACKRMAEVKIREIFGEDIQISDITGKYCFEDHFTYPYEKDDKYFTICVYEKYSDTIRLIPANYCLVAFGREGTKDFLEMDAATKQYLPILEESIKDYEKQRTFQCYKNKPDEFHKCWLAWLISERIQEQFSLSPMILDNIIK